jgi:Asp-tRNA(Asn)/Glu-tRNA(Gln) amidotransferase B subunit
VQVKVCLGNRSVLLCCKCCTHFQLLSGRKQLQYVCAGLPGQSTIVASDKDSTVRGWHAVSEDITLQ